jgi:hypothetical protein
MCSISQHRQGVWAVQIQSAFVRRQAEVLGDHAKEVGRMVAQGASEMTKSTLASTEEVMRSRPEAA